MKKNFILSFSFLFFLACSVTKLPNESSIDTKVGTDFHMHIHSPPKEYDDLQFNAERALFAAESIGLNRALVLSKAYSQNVSEMNAQIENNFVQEEALKNKTRLAGACAVNPRMNWAYKEIKRCASMGMKVLKLHFMASGLDLRIPKDYDIAKASIQNAEDSGMTIIVHANYPRKQRGDEIEKLKMLIEEFPKTRWIIGHAFGREFEFLKNLKHPNFVVEISIVPVWTRNNDDRSRFVQTIRDVGIGKFVFGSDWPVFHPAEILKAFLALPLTKEEQGIILFQNASKFNDLF
ncbi:MAG: amidohydrolase family protein [Bacteriovoracaceae bacterium]